MRFRGAAFVLASVLAVAFAADADAQTRQKKAAAKKPANVETTGSLPKGPAWRFVRQANAPTLLYGAGSEDFQISFSCQPDTGLVRVIAQIGSRGVQPGDGAAIRLANGKKRFEIAGTAFSASGEGIDIGGATRFDPGLITLFKAGETLVVEVPGRKRSLPVQNAGASADAFQKACGTIATATRGTAS